MSLHPIFETPIEELSEWIRRHTCMDGSDLDTEYRQAQEEGRDLSSVEAEFARLRAVPKCTPTWVQDLGGERDAAYLDACWKLQDLVQTLPVRADYAFDEPDSWEAIQAALPQGVSIPAWSEDAADYHRRVHGGVLGRVAGCMLGKPVEGWYADSIRHTAEVTGNWPIRAYLRLPDEAGVAELKTRGARNVLKPAQKLLLAGGIDGSMSDDDTNYIVFGLGIFRKHRRKLRAIDVGAWWLANIPAKGVATAEIVAYRNLTNCILPPHSATYRNCYREWIGALIRVDAYGYCLPGDPAAAAQVAWNDARLSHVKNGIYGAMFAAATVAAAFTAPDAKTAVSAGLAQIPKGCRTAVALRHVLEMHTVGATFDEALAWAWSQWPTELPNGDIDPHNYGHGLTGAVAVALAVLWGGNDYSAVIGNAVMSGYDTDCTAATAGSIWGVLHGADAIPAAWSEPLKDTLRTDVKGYHTVSIRRVADEFAALRSV